MPDLPPRDTRSVHSTSIRVARSDEWDAVADVIRAAYAEYVPHIPEERRDRYLERTADVRSRMDGALLIVAELDGRIVGTITYFPHREDGQVGGWPLGWAGLRVLAVAPEARGYGIGRLLMQDSIRRAREEGAAALGLHTTEMMAIAKAMYERMGFQRVPELDFHPRSGPPSGMDVFAYRFDLSGDPAVGDAAS